MAVRRGPGTTAGLAPLRSGWSGREPQPADL